MRSIDKVVQTLFTAMFHKLCNIFLLSVPQAWGKRHALCTCPLAICQPTANMNSTVALFWPMIHHAVTSANRTPTIDSHLLTLRIQYTQHGKAVI